MEFEMTEIKFERDNFINFDDNSSELFDEKLRSSQVNNKNSTSTTRIFLK